jgi:hypothetical protein
MGTNRPKLQRLPQNRSGMHINWLRNRLERAENGFWRYDNDAEHQSAIRAAKDALRAAMERLAIA